MKMKLNRKSIDGNSLLNTQTTDDSCGIHTTKLKKCHMENATQWTKNQNSLHSLTIFFILLINIYSWSVSYTKNGVCARLFNIQLEKVPKK